MTVFELALTKRQVQEAQRNARSLLGRVAARKPGGKVEIDAKTLELLLTFVTTARPIPRPRVRDDAPKPVVADDDEITPQQAADALGMSRPSVMRLIAKGELHPRKVLSRNKLSRREVLDFRRRSTRRREEALARLSRLSEEYDF